MVTETEGVKSEKGEMKESAWEKNIALLIFHKMHGHTVYNQYDC